MIIDNYNEVEPMLKVIDLMLATYSVVSFVILLGLAIQFIATFQHGYSLLVRAQFRLYILGVKLGFGFLIFKVQWLFKFGGAQSLLVESTRIQQFIMVVYHYTLTGMSFLALEVMFRLGSDFMILEIIPSLPPIIFIFHLLLLI